MEVSGINFLLTFTFRGTALRSLTKCADTHRPAKPPPRGPCWALPAVVSRCSQKIREHREQPRTIAIVMEYFGVAVRRRESTRIFSKNRASPRICQNLTEPPKNRDLTD